MQECTVSWVTRWGFEKRFSTHAAHKRTLTRVKFFMLNQVGTLSKALLTGATQITLDARMQYFMQ